MEARGDGVEASFYSIIAFPGQSLPQQYQNMVLSKWLRSLKYGNDYFKLIESDTYFNMYQKYIKMILGRPNSVVRIAVLADDHDVALGWSVIEGSVLHYVHVQSEQRNKGIGKSLVPVKIDTLTNLTKTGMNIWHNKLPHAVFNPFF